MKMKLKYLMRKSLFVFTVMCNNAFMCDNDVICNTSQQAMLICHNCNVLKVKYLTFKTLQRFIDSGLVGTGFTFQYWF